LQPNLLINKDIKAYEKSLLLAEKKSKRQRNGIWQEKYFPTFTWKLKNNLEIKLRSVLPLNLVKYFNI
jgi:hypothetical protein